MKNDVFEKLEIKLKKIIQVKVLVVYFVALFIYDLLVFKNELGMEFIYILLVALVVVPIYFIISFALKICTSKSLLSPKDFDALRKIVCGISLLCSICLIVQYLVYGFTVSTFLCPVICLVALNAKDTPEK